MSTTSNQVGQHNNPNQNSGNQNKPRNDHAASTASSTDDLRRKAGDVRDGVQELGTAAMNVAGEKLGDLRDSANEYYEAGRDRAYEMEESIEDYIREKPLQSVLIAAGVGFLIGMMRR